MTQQIAERRQAGVVQLPPLQFNLNKNCKVMLNPKARGVIFCQSFFLGLNQQGHEANKPLLTSAELQNQWTLIPQ
jgi:hypothetical protein